MRNIPAYAGKTREIEEEKKPNAEHPRVCGENCLKRMTLCKACGTSPLMRGKPVAPYRNWGGVRNIPAYAGKTGRDLVRFAQG